MISERGFRRKYLESKFLLILIKEWFFFIWIREKLTKNSDPMAVYYKYDQRRQSFFKIVENSNI